MKNFKKVLAYAMSIATLGSLTLIPMNVSADVVLDNSQLYIYESDDTKQLDYQLPDDFDIQSVIEDENHTIVLDGTKFILTDICVEISDGWGHSGVRYDITNDVMSTIEKENDGEVYYVEFFFNREEDDYLYMYVLNKNVENNPKVLQSQSIAIAPAPTVGESENKPITEFTVGDSTFPRGDINLDGKVNTVDLLMLKKYLLGLMEW